MTSSFLSRIEITSNRYKNRSFIANSCISLYWNIITGFNLPIMAINKLLLSLFHPIFIFNDSKLNEIQMNLVISFPIWMISCSRIDKTINFLLVAYHYNNYHFTPLFYSTLSWSLILESWIELNLILPLCFDVYEHYNYTK